MSSKRKDDKPRGKMTAYAFFVQTCREEHRRRYPEDVVNFTDFSRKCSASWKTMSDVEKGRFTQMSVNDKARYNNEMLSYLPSMDKTAKRKKTKDPNAPKRPLSAFFMFCNTERARVREEFPTYSIREIAKELGRRWSEEGKDKSHYERLAQLDKQRYDLAMLSYRTNGGEASTSAAQNVATTKRNKPDNFQQPDKEDHDEKQQKNEVDHTSD